MKAGKTRVIVNFEGRSRQLFSVEETNDGTALISVNMTYDRGDAVDQRYQELRHSVHPSTDSSDKGFTVVTTIRVQGKKPEKKHCYVVPNGDHENAIVAIHLPGRLCSKAHEFRQKKKEDLICMYDMPYPEMLAYVIVCSKSGLRSNQSDTLSLKITEIKVGEFVIIILSGFIPVPPSYGSLSAYTTTRNPSSPEFSQMVEDEQIIAKGLSPDALSYEILRNLLLVGMSVSDLSFSESAIEEASSGFYKDNFIETYRKNTSFMMADLFPHNFIDIPSKFLEYHDRYVANATNRLPKAFSSFVEEVRASNGDGLPALDLTHRMAYSVSRFSQLGN